MFASLDCFTDFGAPGMVPSAFDLVFESWLQYLPPRFEYSQASGEIYAVNGVGMKTFLGAGYSGDAEHLNEPAAQALLAQGPIPAGTYEMTAVTQQKGPDTVVLEPDPANIMFGRDGFLIHGDNAALNNTASEGCIVIGPLARAQIIALMKEGVTSLQVQP